MSSSFKLLEKAFPFLHQLPLREQKLLTENVKSIRFDPDKVLIEDGFSCVNAFFVLTGTIRVFKVSEEGREVTLYRIRAGETCLMTVSCIMGDSEFQAVARVEEPTEMLILPANVFKKMLEQSPLFLHFIFEKTLQKLKEVMIVVEKVTFDSMQKRVALFLHDSMLMQDNDTLRITHEQIAYEIGSAREVVTRTLKDLAAQNIVQISRGTVQVLNTISLKSIILS